MTRKVRGSLIAAVVVGVISLIVAVVTFKVVTVDGNEMAIHETWSGGVDDVVLMPKTHMFVPGFTHSVYVYDMSSRIYVMNDKPGASDEYGEGRQLGSYTVQSAEGQDLTISLNVRWRLDPDQLVHLHKTIRTDFDEKILRPSLLRVVKDESTIVQAIDAYSGPGLVALQKAIETRLISADSELRKQGIIVENFVIEHIELDAQYIAEIKAKQVAVQRELRAVQEEKAALAEAGKAKAEAQSDYERAIVLAQTEKERGILAAEQEKEQAALEADAEAYQITAIATAERAAAEDQAAAILALGEANATAQKLRLSAYSAPGAENFVRIEVAKSMAESFRGIRGYLPADMTVNMLGGNFMGMLDDFLGGRRTIPSNANPNNETARP